MPHETFMRRCLDLASNAASTASPNPLVGSVIVHGDRIIGEGFHHASGLPHAEVNAVNAVADEDKPLLKDATLYVNLEPCSHHGRTPPCCDMIIAAGIPRVVIGAMDTNALVNGEGIRKMKEAAIDVTTGVLERESRDMNKRFFTFQEKRRPYVVLKWAQSRDGFMAPLPQRRRRLSNALSQMLAHKWRTEEDVIFVGFNTAWVDNPSLDARLWPGRSPHRAVYDPKLQLTDDLNIFRNDGKHLWVFNNIKTKQRGHVNLVNVDANDWVKNVLGVLHDAKCLSVLIEGGTKTIDAFLAAGAWDEARVFITPHMLGTGYRAPVTPPTQGTETRLNDDALITYFANL